MKKIFACVMFITFLAVVSSGLNIGLDAWTTNATFYDNENVKLNINVTNYELSLSPDNARVIVKTENEIIKIPIEEIPPDKSIVKTLDLGKFDAGTYRLEIYIEHDFLTVTDKTQTQYQHIQIIPSEPIRMKIYNIVVTSIRIPENLVIGKEFEIKFDVNSSTDSGFVEFGIVGKGFKTEGLGEGVQTISEKYKIEKAGSHVFEIKTFIKKGDEIFMKDYRTENLIVMDPSQYEHIEYKKIEQKKGNITIEPSKQPERNLIEEVGCFLIGGCKGDLIGPRIKDTEILKQEDRYVVNIVADDTDTGNSAITGCSIRISYAEWKDMIPFDGLFDSAMEKATFSTEPFSGDKVVEFRCTDEWGNIGYSSVTASGKVDLLIVTVGSKLKKSSELNNAIQNYIRTLEFEGLKAKYLELDSEEVQRDFGITLQNPSDWQDVKRVLDRIIYKVKPKYILILGGVDIVPMPPAQTKAKIPAIPVSDDRYADTNLDGTPDISVGRIPTPVGNQGNIISSSLNAAIVLHKQNRAKKLIVADTCLSPPGCGGINDLNEVSEVLFNQYCNEVSDCKSVPPYCSGPFCRGEYNLLGILPNYNIIYIQGHGSGYHFQAQTNEGNYSFLYGSEIYKVNLVSHPVVSTIACHGGVIDCEEWGCIRKEGTAFAFLANGGSAYIGNTRYGYGGITAHLLGEIYKGLKQGKTLGDSVLEMKKDALKKSYSDWINAVIYEIQLYGDPTLTLGGI